MHSNDQSTAQDSTKKSDPLAGLSTQYKKFVLFYSEHGNGARAAREAGYAESSSRVQAHKLLRMPAIKAALGAVMEENAMGPGEAMGRLTIWARGNIEPFLTGTGDISLDHDLARENIGLVKKYKRKKEIRTTDQGDTIETITTEIEMYDAMSATDKLLQIHGKYKLPVEDPSLQKEPVVIEMGDGVTIQLKGIKVS